jgi:predicted nucleic acid-binding protein
VSSASTTYSNPEPPNYILDSFAVLAYLKGEQAGKRVREVLNLVKSGECRVKFSLINLGEVVYLVERRNGLARAQEILALLQQEPIDLVDADRAAILSAAHIKANHAISYADAFVVSAAQTYSGTILTGDPEFHALEDLVKVEWLAN